MQLHALLVFVLLLRPANALVLPDSILTQGSSPQGPKHRLMLLHKSAHRDSSILPSHNPGSSHTASRSLFDLGRDEGTGRLRMTGWENENGQDFHKSGANSLE